MRPTGRFLSFTNNIQRPQKPAGKCIELQFNQIVLHSNAMNHNILHDSTAYPQFLCVVRMNCQANVNNLIVGFVILINWIKLYCNTNGMVFLSNISNVNLAMYFTNPSKFTHSSTVSSGFPQSLSGSETDVSTSNENLSRVERFVVRHTARVEPQGQENHNQNNNNRNSLKV